LDDVYVVFNPHSGKGRGAALVEPLLAALGGGVAHGLTQGPGDEARLATEAAARGFRRIVAVGGDGTWSNVANALLGAGAPAALGLVAGGTGCDLAKSLAIPPDVEGAAAVIRGGRTRAIDVGRIEGRHFLNVAGFGFDIAVIEDSWRAPRLPGGLVYVYCALRQIYRFPGFPVEMATDGQPPRREDMLMLVIANGRVFGGGFQIAPGADLGDGALDAVAFGNMPARRRLPLMARLLRGTHGRAPEVKTARAPRFRLSFEAPPAYETDGEWNRARSADLEVSCVPGALRVLVP
jgi:diacylglycerol kinase (ATP)